MDIQYLSKIFRKEDLLEYSVKMLNEFIPNTLGKENIENSNEKLFRKYIFSKMHIENEKIENTKDYYKIIEILSEVIKANSINNTDFDEIKGKLGNDGMLDGKYYKIKYLKEVTELMYPYGINKTDIENCIIKSNDVYTFKNYNNKNVINYYHKIVKLNNNKEFALIVGASGKEDELTISEVWKYYLSEKIGSTSNCTILLLSSFAQKFGIYIEVDGKQKKFFLNEKVNIVDEKQKLIEIKFNNKHKIFQSAIFRKNIDGNSIDLGAAYAIDLYEYEKNLVENDVHIEKQKNLTTA